MAGPLPKADAGKVIRDEQQQLLIDFVSWSFGRPKESLQVATTRFLDEYGETARARARTMLNELEPLMAPRRVIGLSPNVYGRIKRVVSLLKGGRL